MSREDPKCWRANGGRWGKCGQPLSHHVGDELECPQSYDGGRRTFLGRGSSATRVGNSFSAAEVEMLNALITGAMRWRDAGVLARRPEFASLAGKARAMRARLERQRAEAGPEQGAAPEGVERERESVAAEE